jgi:hypothetical protein
MPGRIWAGKVHGRRGERRRFQGNRQIEPNRRHTAGRQELPAALRQDGITFAQVVYQYGYEPSTYESIAL